jgi:tight adherence protein C
MHAGDLTAPLARLIFPEFIIEMVRRHGSLEPAAERLGPHRILGLTLVAGVVTAALAAAFLSSLGWDRLALASTLLAPGMIGVALLEIWSMRRARRRAIRREFPHLLDLLVLLCRAGASTPVALTRVAADRAGTVLGRELGRAIRSINLGTPRAAALAEMAARVDVADVTSFVATLTQAEQLGRPTAEILEQFADRLRLQRLHEAEATAGSAGVKIMGPAIVILVATTMLLLGPFLLKLWREGLPF